MQSTYRVNRVGHTIPIQDSLIREINLDYREIKKILMRTEFVLEKL